MKRLTKSIGFALNGIQACFKQEPNFKIHVACTLLAVAAGTYFKINSIEWIIIVICIGAVLAAELMNTAIEQLCNMVYKERHQVIKRIKDLSAAAVLVIAMSAAICAAIIFIPKIILLINQ